jgi:anti-sigma factor RsiW
MKHQTETNLRAYLDGELDEVPARIVERHMAECADCAATAAELHETAGIFTAALAYVDQAEPEGWRTDEPWQAALPAPARVRVVPTVLDPADVIPIGRTRTAPSSRQPSGRVTGPAAASSSTPRGLPAAWRWAAAVVLLAGAGGAAALTGVFGNRGEESSPEAVATEAATTGTTDAGSGIFVAPVAGQVEIVLTRAPAGSRIIVTRNDADEVGLEVSGQTVPRFTVRAGHGTADLADRAAVVRIGVPRGLTSVSVVWEGRIVVRIEGDTVTPIDAGAAGLVLGGNE